MIHAYYILGNSSMPLDCTPGNITTRINARAARGFKFLIPKLLNITGFN